MSCNRFTTGLKYGVCLSYSDTNLPFCTKHPYWLW